MIEKRQEAERARRAAEELKGRNKETLRELKQAKSDMEIAERRLWASLEGIEDGFALFDPDHRMVTANRAFLTAFDDMDCVSPGISYEELVEIAIGEGIVDPGERQPVDWTGWMKRRWISDGIQPVTLRLWNDRFVRLSERRTEDGDVVMLAINMTQTMRREKALEQARFRAEAASRAKSAFLANMSHEIRTPMNGVLAMAELLAEGQLDDEQKLCVDTIRTSGEALLVIINDVLDYSKIEAAKLALLEEPFDLEETAGEVVTAPQPVGAQQGRQPCRGLRHVPSHGVHRRQGADPADPDEPRRKCGEVYRTGAHSRPGRGASGAGPGCLAAPRHGGRHWSWHPAQKAWPHLRRVQPGRWRHRRGNSTAPDLASPSRGGSFS